MIAAVAVFWFWTGLLVGASLARTPQSSKATGAHQQAVDEAERIVHGREP